MSNRTSKVTVVALNASVMVALAAMEVDGEKVRASINAAIGRAQLDTTKTKASSAAYSSKTEFSTVKETEVASFVSKEIAMHFLAFHDAELKLQKLFGAREVTIPHMFKEWLAKHKVGSEATGAANSAPMVKESQLQPA